MVGITLVGDFWSGKRLLLIPTSIKDNIIARITAAAIFGFFLVISCTSPLSLTLKVCKENLLF